MGAQQKMYSEEEARRILARAAGMELANKEFSRTHLQEMAEEIGISPDQLEAAEQEWLHQQEEVEMREAFITHQRAELKTNLAAYVLVNTFLFILSGTLFIWTLLGWGLALAFHAWKTFHTEGEDFENEFEKWRRKQHAKKERRRRLGP